MGMNLLAFDSKDFLRRKLIYDINPETKEPFLTEEASFYTPLGVGVEFNDTSAFRNVCVKRVQELVTQFNLTQKRLLYDSYSLREELSHFKAIPFCDQLIQKLTRYIELVHFTYVILPPNQYPTVSVGGYRSPTNTVRSPDFLRSLGPMFPHISAWSYLGKREISGELQLDGFNSRQTHAWSELISKVTPKVFPHGDECNPYIMISDIFAYLTDAKLYNQKKGLNPDSLKEIWKSYGFQTDTHFLDIDTQPMYRWNSDDPIDLTPYLARPMIFLLVDELEKLQPTLSPVTTQTISSNGDEIEVISTSTPEEKRFKNLVRHMEPWYSVTAYAYYKGGAAQLFNYHMDKTKVQNGDTLVYIGNQSKSLAESFSHWLDVEVLSAKEVRNYVKTKKV
jgi:hypothetical protein